MNLEHVTPIGDRFACASPVNAMTVDVEDYFQVYALEERISRASWDSIEPRVVENTERILALFADASVRATFFTLGWVAERFPQTIRSIVAAGHELASHGYDHSRVFNQSEKSFAEDVRRTKRILEDASGQEVLGFRAASYSIGESELWALDVLAEVGYRYSSSIYPIRHDLYGIPDSPRFAFRYGQRGLLEFPVTTVEILDRRIPCGGGGYFRLLPYSYWRWAIDRVNRLDRQPSIFYFHPWEIDPGQPRVEQLSLRSRFRHYVNLDKTEGRLRRLLADFRWAPMREVFRIAA